MCVRATALIPLSVVPSGQRILDALLAPPAVPLLMLLCPSCRRPIRGKPAARGLCANCYHRPEVRERYPLVRHRAARPVGWDTPAEDDADALMEHEPPPLPRSPTDAKPGSKAKIKVMRDRFAAGRRIFHPADAPMDAEAAALGVAGQAGVRHEYGRRARYRLDGRAGVYEEGDGDAEAAELGMARAARDSYLVAARGDG